MNKKLLPIVMVTMLVVAVPVAARECADGARHESTPTSRFKMTNDTVVDIQTGLTWMRCAVGQTWDGATCVGAPRAVDWNSAFDVTHAINDRGFAGEHDWRVPVVPELASIVELQCFNPRVNADVFPATPSDNFWTSMEKMGTQEYAYTLDFGGGTAGPTLKTQHGALRLVRGGPWWTPPAMP